MKITKKLIYILWLTSGIKLLGWLLYITPTKKLKKIIERKQNSLSTKIGNFVTNLVKDKIKNLFG